MAQNLNYPINRAGGPVDDRTEVQHESDINSLESMYVGQLVHVIDNDKFFRIKSVDALGSPTSREVVAYTEITSDKMASWDGKQDAITPENTLSPNNIKDVTMNGKLAAYGNSGVLGNSGISTNDVAVKSEMNITDGTGADAGTTTIQLKNGTSKKVLTQHQSLDGKVDKVTGKGLSTNDYDNTEKGKVANAIQTPSATENDKIPVMRNGSIAWESKPSNGQDGADGKSAYEIWYDENGYDDPTTYNEDYFLASLKAQFGSFVPAEYGTDGKPNDGSTDITASVNTTNHIYLVDDDQDNPTTKVMWITIVDETNPQSPVYTWTSIGTVNVNLKFNSGESINNVKIDNTKLVNPSANALAKAGDAMKLAAKLEGITFDEDKATVTIVSGVYIKNDGSFVGGNTNNKLAIIPLNLVNSVRFLGVASTLSTTTAGYCFGNFEEFPEGTLTKDNLENYYTVLDEEPEDWGTNYSNYYKIVNNVYTALESAESFLSGTYYSRQANFTKIKGVSYYKQDSIDAVEIPIEELVPDNAAYLLVSIWLYKNPNHERDFYCYLQSGERVIDLIPQVVDNATTDDSTKALSAKQGMILKQSLLDTYVNETKVNESAITPISGKRVTGDQGLVDNNSAQYAIIDITDYPKVRFSGLNMKKTNTTYINTGYQFGHYEDGNFVVDESYFYPHTEEDSNKVTDIVANVPEGSTHLRTNVKYSALALDDFYCYLRDDNTVITDKYLQEISKKPIKIDWNEVLDTMESPYGRGTQMSNTGAVSSNSSRNTIALNLPPYKYIKYSCFVSNEACVLKFVNDNNVTIGPIFNNNTGASNKVNGLVELQQYKILGATKCVLCTSNGTINNGSVVTVFTNEDEFNSDVYLGNLKSDVEELKGYVEHKEDTSDILYHNDDKEFLPKMMSAKKRYYTSTITNKKYPVVIAHISDVHGNFGNVDRFLRFCDHYSQYIDIKLNTGDIVADKFSDGVVDYHSDNIINIIGNHDVSANGGHPELDLPTPTQNEVYNCFIKPWVSNWEVNQPDDAEANGYCYFHKDFNDQKLRLVCVDILNYDSTENTWLESVLSNAKTNGYHVVIATHFAGSQQSANDTAFEKINCGYSTRYTITGSSLYGLNPYAYHMIETVQSFTDDDGNFVGYLSGHFHSDFIAKVEGYPNQLIYSIGATKAGEMRDFDHTLVGTRMQDEFQIVSINTDLNIIKLFKVGANWDAYGQKRDSICIKYTTGEIIGEEFRTDIATNASNIATNTSNISTNAGNITINSNNIATNSGDITAIKQFLTSKFPTEFPSEQTGE